MLLLILLLLLYGRSPPPGRPRLKHCRAGPHPAGRLAVHLLT
jgi:hypothetical protein